MVTPEGLIAILGQMSTVMQQAGVAAGDVLHSLGQLQDAVAYQGRGYETTINQMVTVQVETASGKVLELVRIVDVVARKAGELDLHIEHKTGDLARALPTLNEAIFEQKTQLLADLIAGATGKVENLWKIQSTSIDSAEALIQKRLSVYATFLQDELTATETQVKRAIESMKFEDAFGNAIEFTWSPDGPIARRALKAASGSPDFGPAMEVLFGPSGKMADVAHDAALGVNLGPAEESFEKKLEDGVTAALGGAGDKASAKAAESLGQKISSGATALGTAMTSIPQLYDSVTKLGEAWDKPNKSTKDYMDLLGAAGGAVSQAGQVLQAFAGITQIASAAQAVFNAVMAMNPVVLVVLAVVALIAVIVLLIVYWDQVKAALRDNPWLAVAAVMLGVIGIIIVVIAYWDEIKLAVLIAANFISIQVQTIGQVFAGLGVLVGQVWAWIVATAQNAGIGVINTFIAAGTAIQNFFIGLVNTVLGIYNQLADSAAGQLAGLSRAALIPQVDVQTRLIPPKEVPQINVAAAFTPQPVKGGLEGQIAAQEDAVANARKADEERRAKAAAEQPTTAPAGPPGAPALPPGAVPPTIGAPAPAGLPGAAGDRPALPLAAAPAAPTGAADQSVHVEGGITVNINAERLEADAARLLSDELIQRIQERLGSLRSEQDFRTGTRAPAPA
ncbi:hypothetical protein [Kitasatospora sp. NPDC047058]|uniref:hypothetical protein n=1 Tax=Kitasatospora sp. NPDC047058 TaxID=3155620 RepID=UPI0034099C79